MLLIHYSHEEIVKLDNRIYSEEINRLRGVRPKPVGLWVSVEDDPEDGWLEWSRENDFRLEDLTYKYRVILREDAKILHLKGTGQIIHFSRQRCKKELSMPQALYSSFDSYSVDWDIVKEEYQGIIISPYDWACRMHVDTMWYYGWDCASGCLWDLSCIDSFELIDSTPVEKKPRIT